MSKSKPLSEAPLTITLLLSLNVLKTFIQEKWREGGGQGSEKSRIIYTSVPGAKHCKLLVIIDLKY